MNNNKKIEEKIEWVIKRFDERYPISIDYPPIPEMEAFTQIEIDNRVKRAKAKHEDQVNFLRQALQEALEQGRREERERIIDLIENMKKDNEFFNVEDRDWETDIRCGVVADKGYNKAIEDIIKTQTNNHE